MDPISLVLIGVGGLTNLIGSYMNGEITERQFNREMAFKERELNETLALKAKEFGLSEKQLRQQWNQFTMSLANQKAEFAKTFGLQKEQVQHQKYMDIIAPAIERARRSKNLIQGFSQLVKSGQTTAPRIPSNPVMPAAPANALAPAAAPAPAPSANPVMQGVA